MTALKPRERRVVIYQGDDIGTLADLDLEIDRAKADVERIKKESVATTRTMGEADENFEATARLVEAERVRDEFAEQAERRGVVVMLEALPRSRWRDLMKEHPPRDRAEHPGDYQFGPCNMDTFPDALLPQSIDRERSTIEGELADFLESLSSFDYYERLFLTAFALNRGSAMADPTQRLLSTSSQTSAATSN